METINHTVFKYIDGSNNSYLVSENQLKYRPIQPENSSSGFYSGGEPQETSISIEDLKQIQEAFAYAAQQLSDHQEKRVMGSGLIIIGTGENRQRFLIKRNSDAQKAVEELLKNLLERDSSEE